MKYKCCKHILGSINVHFRGFKYCNEVWEGPEFILYYDENAFEKNEQRRLQIIEEMKNGKIPERCQKCPMIELKDWGGGYDGKINIITIFNWKHCNAACFYCSVHSEFSQDVKKSDDYDALPIIEKLIQEKRLNADTIIRFMGGEPTMLEEFPDLVKLLLEQNCRMEVLTNGIKYEPVISEMLKAENHNTICISLDCGTKESYKKIKRVDKFDDVTSNIKKYIKEADDKSNRVKVKYIIFPNVNDNKKEIDAFFEFCKSANVKTVVRTLNYLESQLNTTKNKIIETSVIKAYEYFKKQAENCGMDLEVELWAESIVENKVYNCRQVPFLTKLKAEMHFFKLLNK